MRSNAKAMIFEEGGKLLSDIIRIAISRPRKPSILESVTTTKEPNREELPLSPTGKMVEIPLNSSGKVKIPIETSQEELDYRWECCMKHLGGASILLREAYERAIDEGIGEGTAEKIMETLNEHSGMESDLEKMLNIPEAKEQAEKLLSGIRSFRNAAWKAKLTTGSGTKEDIADARLWNGILYTEAYNSAKSQPGQECIREEVK